MLNCQKIFSVLFLGLLCVSVSGCGKEAGLMGRWYNKDLSIRFRSNGTVLYNSRSTGLVEGQYQYEPTLAQYASTNSQKNLTIWLPQPANTLVLDFELRELGNDRIQLKPIRETQNSQSLSNTPVGMVLKRAEDQSSNTNDLESKPPLVSASPNQAN